VEQDDESARPIIAPYEVKRLQEVIQDVIQITQQRNIDQDPLLVRHPIYQGSPIEQELDMWLIDDGGRYGQLWLDTSGQLWYFSLGDTHIDIKVDMTTVSAGVLGMYIHDIEVFKTSL
jgi:hypothetical protein